MHMRDYTVTFHTPAFLGDAEQNGRWRTPPFKALLRQWWRVAYAADHGFQVDLREMRRAEGLLFGHAWLEDDRDARGRPVSARKGAIRIRLERWDTGKLTNWPAPDQNVPHPEVKNREGRVVPVGSQLYLGYGPLTFSKKTTLKANAAIQVGETARLSLAVPDKHVPLIDRSLWLIDHFGAIGGRSRNGWGSFSLAPIGETPPLNGRLPARPWHEALGLDWPHAIGADDAPLIWQTRVFDDWKPLMRELAIIKIGLRTQFPFNTGKNAPHPEARHWLSHPVTKHNVGQWGQARLPNSLRFKVRSDGHGKFVGVTFHVPALPPDLGRGTFNATHHRQGIEAVWQQVHRFLDAPAQQLRRIPE